MNDPPRRGLYAIVGPDALGARDPLAFADALLRVRPALFALQLRAKHASAREVLALARPLAERCRAAGVDFYVNDRPDLALLAGAAGVHVGQDDLPVPEVRRIAPGLRVGLSTHSLAQAEAALADAARDSVGAAVDYLAIGPVFSTASKARPDPVVGLEGLAAVARCAAPTRVPVVAIGGITLERAAAVREAGAGAAAVIAALAQAGGDAAGSAWASVVTERARALSRALAG